MTKKIKKKLNTKMAQEQMCFQQFLKNVQYFGFTFLICHYAVTVKQINWKIISHLIHHRLSLEKPFLINVPVAQYAAMPCYFQRVICWAEGEFILRPVKY